MLCPEYRSPTDDVGFEMAKGPRAPSGRKTIPGCRIPGRCPGLASTGAFSAGRSIFVNNATLTLPLPLDHDIHKMTDGRTFLSTERF